MSDEADIWGNTGEAETCMTCGGSGLEYGETCVTCGGLGFTCWPEEEKPMTDLIARIESADGPSRELDAEIFIAACHPTWRIQTECKLFPEQVQTGRIQEPDGCGWRNAPAYTASIDAALTLVPDGWDWELYPHKAELIHPDSPGADVFAGAATPALALAAAALKARGV